MRQHVFLADPDTEGRYCRLCGAPAHNTRRHLPGDEPAETGYDPSEPTHAHETNDEGLF